MSIKRGRQFCPYFALHWTWGQDPRISRECHMPYSENQQAMPGAEAMKSLTAMMPQFVTAAARMQGEMFNAYMKCNIELLDFLRSRCEEDRKLALNVTKNGDASQAFDTLLDFWRKGMLQYFGEAGKLASMNSELAAEAAKRMTEEAQGLTKNVPMRAAA